jgi:hypothetical protein
MNTAIILYVEKELRQIKDKIRRFEDGETL